MQHLAGYMLRGSNLGNPLFPLRASTTNTNMLGGRPLASLNKQFQRLDAIASAASTFLFFSGWRYVVPALLVGIIRQTSTGYYPIPKRSDQRWFQNYLVLAERVPLEFTMEDDVAGDEPYPTGVVLAPLTENYAFIDWTPDTCTLASLNAIHWCSDGKMETACTESSGRFNWEVLLRAK